MGSRTTDDYEQMALTGCVALTEPAFWAGYDSVSPGFRAYFDAVDRLRAQARREGRHQALHVAVPEPKEAEDRALAARSCPSSERFLKNQTSSASARSA